MPRAPGQRPRSGGDVGDEVGRVAGPPGPDLHGDLPPGHPAGRLDHLPHRGPLAGAQVPGPARPTGPEPVQRQEVPLGEVRHVDEVADAAAVLRRVVVAVDHQRAPFPAGHRQHRGDEVRPPPLGPAEVVVGVEPGGAEVTQRAVGDAGDSKSARSRSDRSLLSP